MHNKIKVLKWFVLAFVAGFLLPRSYGPVLTADLLGYQKTQYDGLELEEAIKAFHLANNEIVNSYLELLLDPDYASLGYVSYPPDLEDTTQPLCDADQKNVSTFCLAVVLNTNLEEFNKYLVKEQDKLDFTPEDEETAAPRSLDDALEAASSQRTIVDNQILLAEDTLDLTLAVYNQVQIVYPIHEEMLDLIRNLDDYRGNLAEIRNIIELYPSKFNGASTAQCK